MSMQEPEGFRLEGGRTYLTQTGKRTRRQEIAERLGRLRMKGEEARRRAEPQIRRAARYAAPRIASTGRFAAAPVRRRIETRTTEFRIRQRSKDLQVLKLQEKLARLDRELRSTRYEIERLRS